MSTVCPADYLCPLAQASRGYPVVAPPPSAAAAAAAGPILAMSADGFGCAPCAPARLARTQTRARAGGGGMWVFAGGGRTLTTLTVSTVSTSCPGDFDDSDDFDEVS